jgi:hypothetical protein
VLLQRRDHLCETRFAHHQVGFDSPATSRVNQGIQILGDLTGAQMGTFRVGGAGLSRTILCHSELNGRQPAVQRGCACIDGRSPNVRPVEVTARIHESRLDVPFDLHVNLSGSGRSHWEVTMAAKQATRRNPPSPSEPSECDERKKAAGGHSSWRLSWLSETADGTRDEDWRLVIDSKQELQLRKKGEPETPGDKPVCVINTPSCQPNRKKVVKVLMYVDGEDVPIAVDPADGSDAVFLTESAVDKFLYPYYHAHRIWDEKMDDLKRKFETHADTVAIRHRAPSNSATLPPDETLRVLARGEDGALRWMSISEFLR